MREVIINMYGWVLTSPSLYLRSLLISTNTGTRPFTHSHPSHSWRSLWLFGQQVRLLDQHVAKETARPGLHHSGLIRCDSCFNICMHARTITLNLTDAWHPPKHPLTPVCTLSSTDIVHCAPAYRTRPNDLGFSSQRLMTLSVPGGHQRINGLNVKHRMRNAAPQTSRVTGGGALTADENYQLSVWTERVRVNSK